MTVPTTRCRACAADVPSGAYCGACGAHLFADRGNGLGRLRIRHYVAAPEEHVLRLSTATALFPQVSPRSRTPFRVGLVVVLALLVTFAVLRWQALMIATAAFGFAVLFGIYLRESTAGRDMARRTQALTALGGAGLGLLWAIPSGARVARSYDVPLNAGPAIGSELLGGLVAPVVGALLMLIPAALVRIRGPARESLDGYVIGAVSAVSFTVASTIGRLTPQLASGPVGYGRSQAGLLVEAGIQGVAMPLTAAAIGGLFGIALWFTRRGTSGTQPRIAWPAVLAATLFAVLSAAALGLLETVPLQQGLHLGMHLLMAILALIALRIGIQLAVLRERPDEMHPDQPRLCLHCDHVIPQMSFCPNCGVAARTAPRSHRQAQELEAPRRTDDPTGYARPGYALPAGQYAVVPPRVTATRRLLTLLGAGVGVAALAAVLVSIVTTPGVVHYTCPPDCGRPPLGTPVMTNPRFTAADGSFSVSYPGPGTAYRAVLHPDAVVLDFLAGDTGTLALFSEPARNRTPRAVAEDLIAARYPDAGVDYEIPNASVGYQPGYGVVVDEYPQDSVGTYTRLRIVVMVAIRNDLALVASAAGPYHQFSPAFGSGHPSGTNLQLALDMAKYVNSFQWRGDPPR